MRSGGNSLTFLPESEIEISYFNKIQQLKAELKQLLLQRGKDLAYIDMLEYDNKELTHKNKMLMKEIEAYQNSTHSRKGKMIAELKKLVTDKDILISKLLSERGHFLKKSFE